MRVNNYSEPNQNSLSLERNGLLSLVKKIRLMSVRGLTTTQKAVLRNYLQSHSNQLRETWVLTEDYNPTDVCLATHKSFFKNDMWIEAYHTIVICNTKEYELLDYEYQVRIAEIKKQLIEKLNTISKSCSKYALDQLAYNNQQHAHTT